MWECILDGCGERNGVRRLFFPLYGIFNESYTYIQFYNLLIYTDASSKARFLLPQIACHHEADKDSRLLFIFAPSRLVWKEYFTADISLFFNNDLFTFSTLLTLSR